MPEDDPFALLGVHATRTGASIGVWSSTADAMELCLFDENDPDWVIDRIPMTRGAGDVWTASSPGLVAGARYSIRADGPAEVGNAFDPGHHLLDPYARGIVRTPGGQWRGVVVDDEPFDWGDSRKPRTPLDYSVIYETHVRGFSKLNPALPEPLRGTYAGLAHPASIEYLQKLGITAVELLPVQQFTSEDRLLKQGRTNYWGYNTLGFFAPHSAYATREARAAGPAAVLREFKGMVKLLHEAGIQVILDVVYNHTAEEGIGGPTFSWRGLDNANYYRQTPQGDYIDVTGCGNSVNTSVPAVSRMVLDSLRYWSRELQIDGFRLDLAATLGRDENHAFQREHELLTGILTDEQLKDDTWIAEPWDVGLGGWQVGHFPAGWSEWNDGYRDRVRRFWLGDVAEARFRGQSSHGIGPLARRLAGSAHVFDTQRGPLASVNFVTAHDGFTLADLTSYDEKHNQANGEDNRDGTHNNNSFNFGVEGDTTDKEVLAFRQRALRNMLSTLLFSAGVPMLTAGDEYGRTQHGNNNAYNQDSELTWLRWDLDTMEQRLLAVTTTLTRLRRENPALRPVRYGMWGAMTPGATQMEWFNKVGKSMTMQDWDSPSERTLQYLAASTPQHEEANRVLLVIHGIEQPGIVKMPSHVGVASYKLLWDSTSDGLAAAALTLRPGQNYAVGPTSLALFRADS